MNSSTSSIIIMNISIIIMIQENNEAGIKRQAEGMNSPVYQLCNLVSNVSHFWYMKGSLKCLKSALTNKVKALPMIFEEN